MKALFWKRLLIRFMAAVWIFGIILSMLLLLGVMFMQGTALYLKAFPSFDAGANEFLIYFLQHVSTPLIVPSIVLAAAIILGAVVTMTLSQELLEEYNLTTIRQASSQIQGNMNYQGTMQHTAQALNNQATYQTASSVIQDMQHHGVSK